MNKLPSRWSAEADIQVQFFDLDPMEIVWHGHYVKYLEMARCSLLDTIDYNYVQMKASGYVWPVIDLHLRYIDSARFGQRLKVHAEIVEWENRLKIDYLIIDPEKYVVIHHRRGPQVGKIETSIVREGEIELSPPGIRVPVKGLLGEVDR